MCVCVCVFRGVYVRSCMSAVVTERHDGSPVHQWEATQHQMTHTHTPTRAASAVTDGPSPSLITHAHRQAAQKQEEEGKNRTIKRRENDMRNERGEPDAERISLRWRHKRTPRLIFAG